MATKTTGSDPTLNVDELFAGEQKASAAPVAGEENLEELEAFLDEFEKNLDTQPPKAAKGAAPAPMADFAEPAGAEELVHGLLKDDDLDLDVEGAPAPAPSTATPMAADDVAEFEPELQTEEPIAPPAFIHAAPAPAGRAVPAAAAGFTRIGFILALVLGGVALLVAIGAGWMAWNTNHALAAVESRLGVGGAAGPDPQVAKLQADVTALRKQVDGLAKVVEGPMGHLADAYQKDMEQLQGRVAELEKRGGAPAVAPAPTPPAPAPTAAEKPAAGKPAVEKPAVETPAGTKPAPEKPAATKPPAEKPAATKPAPEKPAATKRAAEKPDADKPAVEKPAAEKPAAEKPAAEKPAAEKPATAPVPQPKPGAWMVHLTSADEKRIAERDLAKARTAGVAAELTTAQVSGKTWYRVTVYGFASPEVARAYAAGEAKKLGFTAAWIAKR